MAKRAPKPKRPLRARRAATGRSRGAQAKAKPARKPAAAGAAARNVAVVRKIEEAWAASALDDLDRLFAPDFRSTTTPPGLPPTLDTAKMVHQMSMQAFPDRKMEILDVFGSGDKVTVRCRITGTNVGGLPWYGIPANNRTADFEWIGFYTLKNGRAVGHTAINDGMAILAQLGAWTPPPMPG